MPRWALIHSAYLYERPKWPPLSFNIIRKSIALLNVSSYSTSTQKKIKLTCTRSLFSRFFIPFQTRVPRAATTFSRAVRMYCVAGRVVARGPTPDLKQRKKKNIISIYNNSHSKSAVWPAGRNNLFAGRTYVMYFGLDSNPRAATKKKKFQISCWMSD